MKLALLACLVGIIGICVYVTPAGSTGKSLPLDFGEAVIMPTGVSPYYVVAVDLNKDGYLDLATSNTISHSITVFMNRKDGTFAPGVSYPTHGLTPYALAAGDIDGDGYPDLICGNMFSMNLSIFINKGDGTFKPVHNIDADAGPMFTTLADFDNDGKLDIASCNIGHDDVTVLLNRGMGNFEKKGPYKVNGVVPYSIIAADFDRDGKIDLATGNIYSSNVSILMNKGKGVFADAVTYHTDSLTQILYAADFNGDGYPDIVSGNGGSDDVSVLINDGHGKFRKAVNYPVKLPQGVTAADINNDGFIDIATANQSANTTSVLLNKGDGTFTKAVDFPVGGLYPTSVVIADLNNDGKPDLITANSGSSNISIMYNGTHIPAVKEISSSSGGLLLQASKLLAPIRAMFNTALQPETVGSQTIDVVGSQSGPHGLNVVRQPGNVAMELIPTKLENSYAAGDRFFAGEEVKIHFSTGLRSTGGLWMKRGYSVSLFARPEQGGGRLEPVLELPVGRELQDLVAADVDGDGKLDLVATTKNGDSVAVYFGEANGKFANPVTLKTGGFDTAAPILMDFDRDGRLDISVFYNIGDRRFELAASIPIDALNAGVVSSDFDGDGFPDLLTVSKATQELTLLSNRHNRTFVKSFSIGVPNKPSQIVASDFDKDGLDDVMILSRGSGRISLLRNNGDGTFIKRDDLELSPGAVQSFVMRDVNLDGAPDILTVGADQRSISVYGNNGDGTFRTPFKVALSGEPTGVLLADFDASGTPDLLALRKSGLELLFNKGGKFSGSTVTAVDHPLAAVAGDFTGHGAIDVIVSSGNHLTLFANRRPAVARLSSGLK